LAVLLAAAAAAASERRGSTSSPHHHCDDDDEAEVDVVDMVSVSDMLDCFPEVFSRRSRMLALLLVMVEVMSCLQAGAGTIRKGGG
jgi:hypothetical protein